MPDAWEDAAFMRGQEMPDTYDPSKVGGEFRRLRDDAQAAHILRWFDEYRLTHDDWHTPAIDAFVASREADRG